MDFNNRYSLMQWIKCSLNITLGCQEKAWIEIRKEIISSQECCSEYKSLNKHLKALLCVSAFLASGFETSGLEPTTTLCRYILLPQSIFWYFAAISLFGFLPLGRFTYICFAFGRFSLWQSYPNYSYKWRRSNWNLFDETLYTVHYHTFVSMCLKVSCNPM